VVAAQSLPQISNHFFATITEALLTLFGHNCSWREGKKGLL
jgi:hypothetical protein